jgi:hypothetical protein
MSKPKRRTAWFGLELALAIIACGGLALGLSGIRVSRAGVGTAANDDVPWQVTVFGVIATPGGKTVDSRLVYINTELGKLLPKHGFRLLDAQSERIVAGESVTCKLASDHTMAVSLINSLDDNGKVEFRCELFQNDTLQFSTLVKTPPKQLFFCQRPLPDGSQLLIGVGAR